LAIRIGHASTDTPSSGGAAAEVTIRSYYSSLKPTVVLRPTTAVLAEKSAVACEAGCNNNYIEYSQAERGTLNVKAKEVGYDLSKIKTTCYADCSSFMTVCALAGGASINASTMPNCGSMRKVFTEKGSYTALTSADYLNSSDYLKRGDILVRENYLNGSRHTVMVLDNGSKVPADIIDNSSTSNDTADPNTSALDVVVVGAEVNMTAITDTTAALEIALYKTEAGVKERITGSNKLSAYNWSYTLTPIDGSATKATSKKFKASSNPAKLSIDNLTPGTTYGLQIFASGTSSAVSFGTANNIFTTDKKADKEDTPVKFGLKPSATVVNKAYVKLGNSFKRTIIYVK
jgi:hypothetical protein